MHFNIYFSCRHFFASQSNMTTWCVISYPRAHSLILALVANYTCWNLQNLFWWKLFIFSDQVINSKIFFSMTKSVSRFFFVIQIGFLWATFQPNFICHRSHNYFLGEVSCPITNLISLFNLNFFLFLKTVWSLRFTYLL